MFIVKVLCNSVSVFFFVMLLNESLASVQGKQKISKTGKKMETRFETPSINATKSFNEDRAGGKNVTAEKDPFVYRRQHLNESMEKIQMTDNGMVVKSTYVPIVPEELGLNNSDKNQGGSNFQKNESLVPVEPIPATNSTKENFVVKNGKKYRLIKVKKTHKNLNESQVKNKIQRRTFTPLSSLMSFVPLKWMTRQKKNETNSQTRSENATQWAKLSPVQTSEESSKEILRHEVHNSEKIKKLLNLFTIVKFDNGECYVNDIKGTCLHKMECESNGGKFAATCAEDLGVCCYYEKTCGGTTNDETAFFVNEGFPDVNTAAPKVCAITIEKANADVKQLRLDFEIFQLREPTNGTCLHDRLVISGQDFNDVVPEICGTNTGQHVYVDVEDAMGPFNLNVVSMGEYFPRNFRIKVTQVKKDDELMAPKNCLQYYGEPTGYVQTFNYQHNVNENLDEIENGYFNNLNYAICIKKQKGFCSISYENEEAYDTHPTFQLVNVDEEGQKLLPPRQAGAETFDCPDDYIIINGIRLCGEKLNDASIDIDYTRNYPVTDTTNGPFILHVRTDTTVSGRGFNLKFIQHPCLS